MKIALVPVRAGSRGIPRKNARTLAGEPVLLRTLRAAVASSVEQVHVASNDPVLSEIALSLNSEKIHVFDRSPESATDTASTEMVVAEFLKGQAPISIVALLQTTSQLTSASDIDRTLELVESGRYDSALTVAPFPRFLWNETADGWVPLNYDYRARPRRQDFRDISFVENGAVYAFKPSGFQGSRSRLHGMIGAHVMSEASLLELDSPEDWRQLDVLLGRRTSSVTPSDAPSLIVMAGDGVLTDSRTYFTSDGSEMKRFSTRDARAVAKCRALGIATALVTSDESEVNGRRSHAIGIDFCIQGSGDKVRDTRRLAISLGLEMSQIACIGEDVGDLSLMREVGMSFCPSDALESVRAEAGIVCKADGGGGVLREVVDRLELQYFIEGPANGSLA